jgi:hypothetical protein
MYFNISPREFTSFHTILNFFFEPNKKKWQVNIAYTCDGGMVANSNRINIFEWYDMFKWETIAGMTTQYDFFFGDQAIEASGIYNCCGDDHLFK